MKCNVVYIGGNLWACYGVKYFVFVSLFCVLTNCFNNEQWFLSSKYEINIGSHLLPLLILFSRPFHGSGQSPAAKRFVDGGFGAENSAFGDSSFVHTINK